MIKQCPKCRREYDTTNTLCPVDGTVLDRVGDPLEGQTLAGKYRIDERISAGGMGAVYRATHVMMEKKVAVKVLHPSLASDDNIVQRFTREARAASRISHPHALNVTDFGESENGVVFLVMEYLRGRTLKELIREEGALPLPRAVEIMRQVAGSLDAAHAEGVVHRDLKSDNIMLEEVGGHQDWAKVLDFGIAKIQEPTGSTDPGLTAPNLVIGTPQYMSPEQCAQSSNIDKRSDIYSLGIILFEMLAGQVPFAGDSATGVMMKQMQDAPPHVREFAPDIPVAVDAVIARALAKEPKDRYDSAGELAGTLARAADMGDAVTVPPLTQTGEMMPAAPTNEFVAPDATGGRVTSLMEPAAAHDPGEAVTIVAADQARASVSPSIPLSTSPPASTTNLWRIIIPSALALCSVIGLTYAFSGDPQSGSADAPGALRTDPNSQPVRAVAPAATGEAERDVTPRNAANALPADPGGSTPGVTQAAPPAVGAAPIPAGGAPLIVDTENPNPNSQPEADEGDGEDADQDVEPTPNPPANQNRNTDQRRTPTLLPPPPPSNEADEAAPPPPPTPRAEPSRRRPVPALPAPPANDGAADGKQVDDGTPTGV